MFKQSADLLKKWRGTGDVEVLAKCYVDGKALVLLTLWKTVGYTVVI